MMFRLTPLLLAALLLVPVPVVGQLPPLVGETSYDFSSEVTSINESAYDGLRIAQIGTGLEVDNYRELRYFIEGLPDVIQSTGLTEERVATRVELRMRSAGLTPSELTTGPQLHVFINGIGRGNVFTIEVSFMRVVRILLDDPSSDRYLVRTVFNASTWSRGLGGAHGGSAAYILEALDGRLDEFLNAYLAANQE